MRRTSSHFARTAKRMNHARSTRSTDGVQDTVDWQIELLDVPTERAQRVHQKTVWRNWRKKAPDRCRTICAFSPERCYITPVATVLNAAPYLVSYKRRPRNGRRLAFSESSPPALARNPRPYSPLDLLAAIEHENVRQAPPRTRFRHQNPRAARQWSRGQVLNRQNSARKPRSFPENSRL